MVANEKWFGGGAGATTGFYDHQIEQSARFDLASSSYLSLASGNTSGNNDYWTFSWWWKSSPISTDQTILVDFFRFLNPKMLFDRVCCSGASLIFKNIF